MGLSSYKLYGGNKTTNTKNNTVSLYESLSDVQNQGYKILNNGKILYAKYGDLNDKNASKIRVKVGGVVKALLTTALTPVIWKIEDFEQAEVYKNGRVESAAIRDSKIRLISNSDDSEDTQFVAYAKLPPNFTNAVLSFDWEMGKELTIKIEDRDNLLLKLDNSSPRKGKFTKSLTDREVYIYVYSSTTYSSRMGSWFTITNFQLEFSKS